MAKKKRIINTGIITGALFFLGNHSPNTLPHEFSDITNTKKTPTEKVENPSEPNIEKKAQTPNASKIIPTTNTKQPASVKRRAPVRVYHRFEEIPEISDAEALFYNRKEYTYIVNADVYQKNGNIELKRVLKSELTKANALSLIYRSECETYNPKPNEDQISRYIVDLKILNPTGNYKGPSQMDDMAIVNFIKFLAVSQKYSPYVTPIIKNNKTELDELQSKFTRNDGSPLQQEVRQMLQETPAYKNLKINTQRWSTDASDELKRYISKKEQQISKTKSSPATLTDITKTYLFMTELFPSEDLMIKALEDYNLSAFPINREGKPKHVLTALALSLNLTDKDGNLDATRIPTYAISATLSHVNWKGNGKTALKDAQELRRKKLPNPNDHLKPMVSNWVTGKGRRYGIDEMAKLNILTEDIIYQYQEIEMPGAKNLALKYHNAVQEKEAELFKKQSLNPKESTTVCVDETKDTTSKTFLVALKDFIQLR